MNMRKPILLMALMLLASWAAPGAQDAKDKDNHSNWTLLPQPPPPPPTDIDGLRNEYDAKVKNLQDATDAAAKKYQKSDGTVDTENPGYKKLQQDYVNQKTALRNEYNAKHPAAKAWESLQNTPEGGKLKSSGSNPSSPHSDMDITADTPEAAKAAADHLKGQGHKVTYDPETGMYQDHTADTKIWEPETPKSAAGRAKNPEGYTRSGALEHEGIKSPNAQYDPEGYVEDLNRKYEAAKAKGDVRTMNKIAAKMQEATGKPVDPVSGKMKVDADPYESGEQNFGESEEVKNAKAQNRIKQLDETVKNARDTAKAQSESNKRMRDDLAKKETELGNKKSAKEYTDANKKIENTTPKSEPPKTEPAKTGGSSTEPAKPPSPPPEPGKGAGAGTGGDKPPATTHEPAKPPSSTPEPGKTGTAPPETVKPPTTAPEPVKPPATTEPVKPPSTPEPVKPPTTTEPVKPPSTPPEPVKPPGTTESVKPPSTPPEPVKPPTTPEPVKPPSTEPVKPPTSAPETPPATTEPVKPPSTTPEPIKPPATTPEPVKGPGTTAEPPTPPATTEPVKGPGTPAEPTTTEPVKAPSTPEPAKPPATTPEGVKAPGAPSTGTGPTPPGETWQNPLTGKSLPVGTSGSKIIDGTAKVLESKGAQGTLNVVGTVMVAKDGIQTINKVNEAAAKGDLKTANVEGSKGIGRLGGGWLGSIGGAKAGAGIGTALGDGPGAVVGGLIGAIGGGILGAWAGEKTGETVGPAVIDTVRDGGEKIMDKYYGTDTGGTGGGKGGTTPGGWDTSGKPGDFDRIERVTGGANKDKGPSGPTTSGFTPPSVHVSSSGGSTLTPVPSGSGSTYKPPTTSSGGIDISVPGQDIDDIDFGTPPPSGGGKGGKTPTTTKPPVRTTPPPPPKKEPVKKPEPPKPPPVVKPQPPLPPPEVTQPPGIQVVDKGWVKDGNGVIKVTETKDANGKVIKVTHTEYGPDGKVIKTTDYPGGTGQGVTTPGGQPPVNGPDSTGVTEPPGATTGGQDTATPPAEGTTDQPPPPSGGDITLGGGGLGKPPDAANHSEAYNKLYELGWETERIMELEKIICPKNSAPGFHVVDKAEEAAWEPYRKRLEELGKQRDALLNDPNVSYGDKSAFGSGRWDCAKAIADGRVKKEPFLTAGTTVSNVTGSPAIDDNLQPAIDRMTGRDLRTSEAAALPQESVETSFDRDLPLETVIQERNTQMEEKSENGVAIMGAHTDVKNASNAGHDMIRDAKYTRDAGGQDAQKIASDNQQKIRIEQDKNKNPILNGVLNGIGNGTKTAAGHLGTGLGKGIGDKIFDSGKKTETASTGGTSGSTPGSSGGTSGPRVSGGTSGGGPDGESYGGTSGGTTSGGQTAPGGGPVCVKCGAPGYMEFPGVGWLCHDCEAAGYGYPPDGTTGTETSGSQPVIMADALCPVCGQMYNPAYGHNCPGASAPTPPPEPPPAEMDSITCNECGYVHQFPKGTTPPRACPRCGCGPDSDKVTCTACGHSWAVPAGQRPSSCPSCGVSF
ncbi:MAG TPA: hypothetical protein P5567_07920 [Kiritimatiellia bacterium]|nr:hypothetical protein [Kiritimatiellia bacterium]HRZ12366.1 hypothetical protein [Kiritimatiellia bacterium]HSA17876.1 hypothetical protein [Kiritimatiellia bacterium]